MLRLGLSEKAKIILFCSQLTSNSASIHLTNFIFFSWIIRFGDIDNNELVERNMGKIYLHPDYKTDQAYYDLAIVKVFHVDYSDTIAFICLPPSPDSIETRFVGKSVTVAGWGSFNLSNVASDTLKTAPLTILPSR